MRQRNIKNLDERIEENARLLITNPRSCKGNWAEIFGNENPIYLEIGCGKGNFIVRHATEEKNKNFIACEGQASVVLRALEKAEEGGSENLRIFIDYVNDLADYFEKGEISGIYLNFSDPWPKARHAKRRLITNACRIINLFWQRADSSNLKRTMTGSLNLRLRKLPCADTK